MRLAAVVVVALVVVAGAWGAVIEGTDGPDVIYGTANADFITLYTGADFADGRGGADTIRGRQGDDELWGQGGADNLYGGCNGSCNAGENRINREAANDLIGADNGRRDVITCGSGTDTIHVDGIDVYSSEAWSGSSSTGIRSERDPRACGRSVGGGAQGACGEALGRGGVGASV